MSKTEAKAAEAVAVSDEVTVELKAGFDFARGFYAAGRNTLIDQMSQEAWEGWDGAEEMALVSDPDGIDLTDDADCDLAA